MNWDSLAVGIERPPKPGADMDRFWAEMIAFNPSMTGYGWEPPLLVDQPVGPSMFFWWD
jgi:hypothetical protein